MNKTVLLPNYNATPSGTIIIQLHTYHNRNIDTFIGINTEFVDIETGGTFNLLHTITQTHHTIHTRTIRFK